MYVVEVLFILTAICTMFNCFTLRTSVCSTCLPVSKELFRYTILSINKAVSGNKGEQMVRNSNPVNGQSAYLSLSPRYDFEGIYYISISTELYTVKNDCVILT